MCSTAPDCRSPQPAAGGPHGELEKRLVEYSIYTVTTTPKKFVSDAMALVAVSTQETLSCYPAAGRCAGEMHAYKWNTSPHTKCPYSLVKRAMGIMSPDTFYSHQETLVFNKHLALPPVVQCPDLILIPTQVPGIFLSKQQPQLLPIEGAHVQVSALVDALGAYLQDTSVSEWKFIIVSAFKFVLLRQPEAAGCCPDH